MIRISGFGFGVGELGIFGKPLQLDGNYATQRLTWQPPTSREIKTKSALNAAAYSYARYTCSLLLLALT